MSGKHTPGPWTVRDDDTVVGPKGNVVAECCGYSVKAEGMEQKAQGGREANANLIAAAPELLEAVKLYVRLDDDKRAGCTIEDEYWAECHQSAMKAIAKAKEE